MTAYAFSSQHDEAREINITKRAIPIGFIGKFSAVVAVLLVFMTMATFYLGNGAIVPASLLSGIVSSAAAIITVGAAMMQENGISVWVAGLGIFAAMTGSIAAKYVVVARRLGIRDSLPFLLPIVSLLAVSLLTLWITLNH